MSNPLKFTSPNKRLAIQIAVLILASLICYAPSLNSWFNGDDIWQVSFASKVCDGRLELLKRNFVSNYLQLPSFEFYRPLLGITFVLDFLIWKTNPLGYHITNIILHSLSAILLFLLIRSLTRFWDTFNSSWAAFLAAVLFAVSPLHCEDIAWISGRADTLCAPFYLLALYLVTRSHFENRQNYYWFALGSFWLALLSKEIAIGLPAVVFTFYYLFPKQGTLSAPENDTIQSSTSNVKPIKPTTPSDTSAGTSNPETPTSSTSSSRTNRIYQALKLSAPFILAALLFIGIRYMALGTLIGGYSGMMGGLLDNNSLLRWIAPANFIRTIFPFGKSIVAGSLAPHWIVGICIVFVIALVPIRLLSGSRPGRWIVFLLVWALTTLIPLIKIWGLDADLEGSRLLLFFTMPLYMLAPILIFHPQSSRAQFRMPEDVNRSIGLIAISTMSVIALVFAWATYRTNQLWRWAGRELQAVRQQTVDLTASLKSDEKLIVLGIPKYSGGAPVNINSSTLLLMLRPPFTKPAVSRQVITFDSFVVSPADVFKTEIFKRLIRNKRVKGPYVWNHDKLKFDIVSLTPGQEDTKDLVLPFEATEENAPQWQFISNKAAKAQISPDCIDLSDTTSGDQLKIENLQASPLDYNFLEFYIDVKPSPDQSQNLIPLILSWNDIKDKKPENNFALSVVDLKRVKENPRFLIQVSRYWSWFANSKINSLTLHLPKTKAISICKAQLINGDKFIPKIWLKDRLPLNSGEYLIEKWVPVTVLFNGSSNTSAKATEIEISKPNYFFDNRLRGTDSGSAVAWRLTVNAPKGLTDIHPNLFTEPGYYEVRMRSLDEKKNPLGAWSDAITILKLGKGNNVYIDPSEYL